MNRDQARGNWRAFATLLLLVAAALLLVRAPVGARADSDVIVVSNQSELDVALADLESYDSIVVTTTAGVSTYVVPAGTVIAASDVTITADPSNDETVTFVPSGAETTPQDWITVSGTGFTLSGIDLDGCSNAATPELLSSALRFTVPCYRLSDLTVSNVGHSTEASGPIVQGTGVDLEAGGTSWDDGGAIESVSLDNVGRTGLYVANGSVDIGGVFSYTGSGETTHTQYGIEVGPEGHVMLDGGRFSGFGGSQGATGTAGFRPSAALAVTGRTSDETLEDDASLTARYSSLADGNRYSVVVGGGTAAGSSVDLTIENKVRLSRVFLTGSRIGSVDMRRSYWVEGSPVVDRDIDVLADVVFKRVPYYIQDPQLTEPEETWTIREPVENLAAAGSFPVRLYSVDEAGTNLDLIVAASADYSGATDDVAQLDISVDATQAAAHGAPVPEGSTVWPLILTFEPMDSLGATISSLSDGDLTFTIPYPSGADPVTFHLKYLHDGVWYDVPKTSADSVSPRWNTISGDDGHFTFTTSVFSTLVPYSVEAPSAPPAVTAPRTVSTAGTTVSWAAVPRAESYQWRLGSGGWHSTTARSAAVTGLTPGANTIEVRGVNASGAGPTGSATVYRVVPTTLTLSAPVFVYNGSTRLSGTLMAAGSPVAGAAVRIERSLDGKKWSAVKTVTTGSSGAWSYTYNPPSGYERTHKVRVTYAGKTNTYTGSSKAATLQAKVVLGKPSLKTSSPKAKKKFSISAALKPKAKSGSKPAVFKIYRKRGSTYKLVKTVKAKAAKYRSYSKLSVKTSLSKKGTYYVVAEFKATSSYAKTTSARRTFKVK